MSQATNKGGLNYIVANSKWRLLTLTISLIGIFFLRGLIPDFAAKTTFTSQSIFAALIAFGVAIVGLLSFSLLLNFLIRGLKVKIDFNPDDYNVSSGVSEALVNPRLRLPFAISGFLINPLGEELFFRMILLGLLSNFINLGAAIIINIFAYYLLVRKTKELMEFVIIAVIGLITAYLYLQYSVWHAFAANGGFVAGIYATLAVFYYFDSKSQSHKAKS